MIIESGYSRYPSTYFIINQWFAEIDDRQIIAFAGAIRNDPSQAGKEIARPWPGVLILEVRNKDGKLLEKASGEFHTPKASGPLRIVNADATKIILVSGEDTALSFDLATHHFVEDELKTYTSRHVGNGTIVESSTVPYPSDLFNFENYWWTDLSDRRIYLFAGSERQNQSAGVVVKIITDLDGTLISGSTVPIPFPGGEARIVDLLDGKVVVVTLGGIAIAFDVDTGQFNEIVNGDSTKSTGIQVTPTPYQQISMPEDSNTPTIAPTYTRLPTINPYP